ncbi:MAG: hypothetical protein WD646_11370 [Actinomycetota bacterium]
MKLLPACLAALLLTVAAPASLVDVAAADNAQVGDNAQESDQGGASRSGDAIAGQVVGSVGGGDVTADATNRSQDVDVESGDTAGSNEASSFVGQRFEAEEEADPGHANTQTGDNEFDLSQRADAFSGDGVGGQVIGVVTATGGSADVVAANTSEDVDISSGDAASTNDSEVFVGLLASSFIGDDISPDDVADLTNGGGATVAQSVENLVEQTNVATILADGAAANTQDGDNELEVAQSAQAVSGDGVGGQVIGVVSAGGASVDATNRSSDVDVSTGDSASTNDSDAFVGLLAQGGAGVTIDQTNIASFTDSSFNTLTQSNDATILADGTAANKQTGDNEFDLSQRADASSGDGVGGQVIGVVTATGGSADVVAANTSEDVDISSGDAASTNDSEAFVGLLTRGVDVTITQINDATFVDSDFNTVTQSNTFTLLADGAANTQDGDNELEVAQSAQAVSGDGVGGQVIGVVSAGGASVDATNRSSDVDVSTGDSASTNDSGAFVGLLTEGASGEITQSNVATFDDSDNNTVTQSNTTDIGANTQDGDNELDVAQSAQAVSGDGVGGQVLGVVTSAGGSADVVAANTSEDVDIASGDAESSEDFDPFVGLSVLGLGEAAD